MRSTSTDPKCAFVLELLQASCFRKELFEVRACQKKGNFSLGRHYGRDIMPKLKKWSQRS